MDFVSFLIDIFPFINFKESCFYIGSKYTSWNFAEELLQNRCNGVNIKVFYVNQSPRLQEGDKVTKTAVFSIRWLESVGCTIMESGSRRDWDEKCYRLDVHISIINVSIHSGRA